MDGRAGHNYEDRIGWRYFSHSTAEGMVSRELRVQRRETFGHCMVRAFNLLLSHYVSQSWILHHNVHIPDSLA